MKTPSLPNMSEIQRAAPPPPTTTPHPLATFEFHAVQDEDSSNLSFIDMYGDIQSTNVSLAQSHSQEQSESVRSSRKHADKVRNSIELRKDPKLSSNIDRYGFKKSSNFVSVEEYNTWWRSYSQHCQRRKIKWTQLLLKNGLSVTDDSPKRFPPRSEKLKRYIRKGIPAEWRGQAWWYFAKGAQYLQAGVYDQLVESTMNLQNKDAEIIERDLHRTFPDNVHFKDINGEESPLISSLRRVLKCFATYQPTIGYCQSLNFICGLLLIFMDEERAFWMLVIITGKYLPKVHEINLEGVNIDQGVLMLCIRNFLPDVWDKINIDFEPNNANNNNRHSINSKKENNDFLLKLPPITLCTSSWFMSLFIGVLPIETTLRVWDCFLYEDSNFLFKISLSIFKILEPKIINLKDEMEIFQIVQNYPKALIDPSIIFDIIFKKKFGFNNLNQDEINRCKKYVSEQRAKNKDKFTTSTLELNNRSLLDESLWQPDLYGFKKNGLPGVHWNNNLTKKMRIRRNK